MYHRDQTSDRLFLLNHCSVPVAIAPGYAAGLGRSDEMKHNLELLEHLGIGLPENYTLWSNEAAELSVVFFAACRGKLLIRARSLEAAHDTGHAVWGSLVLAKLRFKEPEPLLSEVTTEPRAMWDLQRVLAAFTNPPRDASLPPPELDLGDVLSHLDLRHLPFGMTAIAADAELNAALRQLSLSSHLVYGFGLRRSDFEGMPDDELQADYLSNQAKYELAFVSAFKGLEALLGGMQLKARDLSQRLAAKVPATASEGASYRRTIEVTADADEEQPFSAVLKRFLDIRNATAAHSNATPPKHLRVTPDRVAEVQRFLIELCGRVTGRITEAPLPAAAYVGERPPTP